MKTKIDKEQINNVITSIDENQWKTLYTKEIRKIDHIFSLKNLH